MKNKRSRRAKILLIILALPVILLILTFGLIQTRAFKDFITAKVNSQDMGGVDIELKNLSGLLPFHVRLERLSCSDPNGEFAKGQDLRLDISFWPLLTGRVEIDHLSAQVLKLIRQPQLPDTDRDAPEPEAEPSSGFDLPLSVFVHEIEIPSLALGPDILGQQAELAMFAKGSWQNITRWDMLCNINQRDTQGLKLHLAAAMQGKDSSLDVDVDFQDQPGGLALGQLGLDLPAAVRLRIQGAGPLAGWTGKMHLDMDSQSLVKADLGLKRDPDRLELKADSSIYPQPLLPEALLPVQSGLKTVDLTLAATVKNNFSRARLTQLTVLSELVRIKLQGQADLASHTGEGSGVVELPSLQSLKPLLGTPVSGSARLDILAQGAWTSPELTLAALGDNLHVHGLDFSQAGLTLHPQLIRSDTGQLKHIKLNGELKTKAIHKDNASLLPGPLHASLNSSLDLQGPDLDLRSLRLTMPGVHLAVRGAAKSSGPYHATLSTTVDDLSSFPQVQNTGLSAGLQATSEVRGDWQKGSLENDLHAVLENIQGLAQPADEILGPRLAVDSKISLTSGQDLHLQSLQLKGQHMAVLARAGINLDSKKLHAGWSVTGPDFSALNNEAFSGISGLFKSSGHISGDFQALTTSVDIQGSSVSGPGLTPSTLHTQFQGQIQPGKAKVLGDLQLKVQNSGQQIALQTGIDFAHQLLRLPDLTVQAPNTDLNAFVEYQIQDQKIDSHMELEISDLQWLQIFTPHALQGGLSLNAQIKGLVSQPQISAAGLIRDLQVAGAQLESLDFHSSLQDVGTLQGDVKLKANGLRFGDNRIDLLQLEAAGAQGQAEAQLALSGIIGQKFDLSSKARISNRQGLVHLSLLKGSGHYGELPLSWSQAMQASQTESGLSLSWPELTLGRGTVQIQAKSEGNAVQGAVSAQDIDLNTLPLDLGSDFSGQADLDIELFGSKADPVVNIESRIRGLQSQIGQAKDLPEMNIQAAGSVKSSELRAEVTVDGDQVFDLQGNLNLPVVFALRPFQFRPEGSITAQMKGQADLEILAANLALNGQDLAGTLSMDISCSGSLPFPELNGELRLAQGEFENVQSGTLLQDIQAVIQLQGHRAMIRQLEATDGEQGEIRVEGELGFAPDQDISYSLITSLDQATLIRMEPATATLSGRINLQGSSAGADISGDLKAFPVEIGLPDPGPAGLEGLTIVHAQEQNGSEQDLPDEDTPSFAQNTNLNLQVNIPGGCFVRGRGLDSEWEGDLDIRGPASEPRISGYIAVVRGHLNLLTQRFTLDEGRVSFLSQFPPQPELNLTAVTSVRGLNQAQIEITGSATEPSLTLSSDPPLPRDEILARMLFNRDLSQITPVQAVKLALAVRTLTSGGNGGLMTSLRRNMGLDELTIDTQQTRTESEDSSQVTVGAGKYLRENIYFKVEKGLEEDSGRATVNIQLTPRISVESTAGSEHQGLYISWSYSY